MNKKYTPRHIKTGGKLPVGTDLVALYESGVRSVDGMRLNVEYENGIPCRIAMTRSEKDAA